LIGVGFTALIGFMIRRVDGFGAQKNAAWEITGNQRNQRDTHV
jgi:hypothetical protein